MIKPQRLIKQSERADTLGMPFKHVDQPGKHEVGNKPQAKSSAHEQPSCVHTGAYGTVTSLDDHHVVKIYDTHHWHNIEPFKNSKLNKRNVSLKLTLPTLDFESLDHWIESHEPYLLQHFLIELLCLIKLAGHPRIVRMVDFEIEDQTMSIIMEREKSDLDAWVKYVRKSTQARKSTPIHQLFESPHDVFEQIALSLFEGLDAMHHVGIVHGDIKPNNILIHPDTCTTKICDFSLSNIQMYGIDQQYNMTMIRFQSPEQMCGLGWDHRSDIWSAGLVLIGFWLPGDRQSDWTPHLTDAHADAMYDILDRINPLFKVAVQDEMTDERRQDMLIQYHAKLCAVHRTHLDRLIDHVPHAYKSMFLGILNPDRHARWSSQDCIRYLSELDQHASTKSRPAPLPSSSSSWNHHANDPPRHPTHSDMVHDKTRHVPRPGMPVVDHHPRLATTHHDPSHRTHGRPDHPKSSGTDDPARQTRPEDRSEIQSMVVMDQSHRSGRRFISPLDHRRDAIDHRMSSRFHLSDQSSSDHLRMRHHDQPWFDDDDHSRNHDTRTSSSILKDHHEDFLAPSSSSMNDTAVFDHLEPLWMRPKLSDQTTAQDLMKRGPHAKYIWAPLEQFAMHRIQRWMPSAKLGHIPLIHHWFPPPDRSCFLPAQPSVSLHVFAQSTAEMHVWKHFLRSHADWVFEHDQALDNLWTPIYYQLMSMPIDEQKYAGFYKMMQTIWTHWHTNYHEMSAGDQIRLGLIIFYHIAATSLLIRMTHERLSLKDLMGIYWSLRRKEQIGAVAIRLWDTYQFKLTNHAFYDILQHYIARLLQKPVLDNKP